MVTAEAMNLDDLSKLSKQLNAESDQVNVILEDFQKVLAGMKLGLEVFLDKALDDYLYKEEFQPHRRAWFLGFQEERLTIQCIESEERSDPDDREVGPWWEAIEETYAPLLKSRRELRVRALDSLQDLVDALVAKGQRVLNSIEKGKATVEKLKK